MIIKMVLELIISAMVIDLLVDFLRISFMDRDHFLKLMDKL